MPRITRVIHHKFVDGFEQSRRGKCLPSCSIIITKCNIGWCCHLLNKTCLKTLVDEKEITIGCRTEQLWGSYNQHIKSIPARSKCNSKNKSKSIYCWAQKGQVIGCSPTHVLIWDTSVQISVAWSFPFRSSAAFLQQCRCPFMPVTRGICSDHTAAWSNFPAGNCPSFHLPIKPKRDSADLLRKIVSFTLRRQSK